MIRKPRVTNGMNQEKKDYNDGKKKENPEKFQKTKQFLIKSKHCKLK